MTSAVQTRLTIDEAFAAIERHEISLTGWRGLRLWVASCELQGRSKRAMRIVSAIANSPLAAVEALIEKLSQNVEAQPVELFEEVEQ